MITIGKLVVDSCGIGVSAPKDTELSIGDADITNTGIAFCFTEPPPEPTLIQKLGLPADTPPELVMEALEILKEARLLSDEERMTQLRNTGLGKWLEKTASLATVGTALATIISKFFSGGI